MSCATTMIRRIADEKELHKLVAFLTMGDGGVYKGVKGKNYAFVMSIIEENKDFSDYARNILENITTTTQTYIERKLPRKNQYRLASRVHPIYTKMRDQIYVGNYKSVSSHYLKLLDWESLAILYMSDGSLQCDFRPEIGMRNPSYSITLNMKRLSEGDYLLLRQALLEKQMGMWNVCRAGKYFTLRLKNKFIPFFCENITNYVLPSFQYKIHPEYRTIDPTLVGGDIV